MLRRLLSNDVALKIEGAVDRLAILHGLSAPDRLVVFRKVADGSVAMRFNPAAGLRLGEVVGSWMNLGELWLAVPRSVAGRVCTLMPDLRERSGWWRDARHLIALAS